MSNVFFNHWDDYADSTDQAVNAVTRKTGFDAQAIAQEESRVDTSAMKNGWYVRTENDSNRVEPTLAPGMYLFPEVPATPHNYVWLVGGLAHTIYNEMGTVYKPAKPMAAPAIERVRDPFLQTLAKAVARGGQ